MNEHLSQGDLELFVIDGLSAARAAEVSDHVVSCPVCSAALAREARLEIAFEEIARVASPCEPRDRAVEPPPEVRPAAVARPLARPRPAAAKPARLGFAVALAGTLSLAAGWMLLLMPAARTEAEPGSYTATATDATTAALDGRSLDPLDGG